MVPQQLSRQKLTVVTSYVFECFKDTPWKNFMRQQDLSPTVSLKRTERIKMLNFEPQPDRFQGMKGIDVPKAELHFVTPAVEGPTASELNIKIGDVVSKLPDKENTWTSNSELWYAYIQGIKVDRRGRKTLDVFWLYAPSDTTCQKMKYHYSDELFFSDHCNCKHSAPFNITEVIGKVDVTFFSARARGNAEYFIRQKYNNDDPSFVTFTAKDLICSHKRRSPSAIHRVGDTVLVVSLSNGEEILEPAEIVQINTRNILARQQLRRRRDFGDRSAPPNELVYTERIITTSVKKIHRRCQVRLFSQTQKIPCPYDRDGTGDYFYIVHGERRINGHTSLGPLHQTSLSSKEGFDPSEVEVELPQLRGLDLFCGGGSFGRGLEEGGAVRMEHAVDWDVNAIHTYHSNLQHDATNLFHGSIDDYIYLALTGNRTTARIAKVGEVDFISARSPCQGFSQVNSNKSSTKSLENSSKVASVAASIDFYRPLFAILENVPNIDTTRQGFNPTRSDDLCARRYGLSASAI